MNVGKPEGVIVDPEVVETIVALAAAEVEGVVRVGEPVASTGGILAFMRGKTASKGVKVESDDTGQYRADVHIEVKSGLAFSAVADAVRAAVGDACETQLGYPIQSVDVYIDSVGFEA